MSATLQQADKRSVDPQLVRQYAELGHSGFILWYRAEREEEPDPDLLETLASQHERGARRKPETWLRAVLDLVT